MKTTLLLIGGGGKSFEDCAMAGMESAFSGSVVNVVPSLDTALDTQQAPGNINLLALWKPTLEEASRAQKALDASKLPRWGVIACGSDIQAPNITSIEEVNWSVTVVSLVLRLSAERQRLLRENASFRGDLLSIGTRVAHDLRSPLGGILSAAEALGDYLAERDPAAEARIKPVIESEEELLKLIRQLTMLTGELARPLEDGSFAMASAVTGARESLEGKIARSSAVLIEADDWPLVSGDLKKIQRVWTLLLENSLRHAGTGRRIEFGWEALQGENEFWIANDGPKVPKEREVLLFRPFNRLSEPDSSKGVGLSLVERLVSVHGGRCGYRVLKDDRPQFFFTLPS
jgi:signal transduction histidine kinase